MASRYLPYRLRRRLAPMDNLQRRNRASLEDRRRSKRKLPRPPRPLLLVLRTYLRLDLLVRIRRRCRSMNWRKRCMVPYALCLEKKAFIM